MRPGFKQLILKYLEQKHFPQKKALAMLYKLENETRNLIAVSEKIFATVQKLRNCLNLFIISCKSAG